MSGYVTLRQQGRCEYTDRHSVFIGMATPVSEEAEALRFLATVKKQYPDARHHVYAYVLRDRGITRFSDDREPQGTAGMPVLDAIRKRGIVDAAVVVVRYFGGVLLGTGGLVRAYTEAAVGAITAALPAQFDLYTTLSLTLSYADHQRLLPALPELGFLEEETEYTDTVTLRGTVRTEEYAAFCAAVTERTCARGAVTALSESYGCREV